MAILCVLLTTLSDAQELYITEQQSEYSSYDGEKEWVLDQIPAAKKQPLVPHESVERQGYSEKLYVAYFGATWCRPCREIMGPRMDELRKRGWKVYKFNVDIHKQAAKKLMVGRKVPVVVIMDKGQIVASITGVPTLELLVEKLTFLRDGFDEDEEEKVSDHDSGLSRKVDYLF